MQARNVIAAAAVAGLVLAGGVFLWARSALANEAVRQAVESQMTAALGQPVRIGGIGASVFPRVTMTLRDVTVGEPARATIGRLHVGTSIGALLSRRIEGADLVLESAHIELPLGITAGGGDANADAGGGASVELVSIDRIRLSGVEVASGGRTLRGDAELVWDRGAVAIQEATLTAGDAKVTVAGRIASVAGPTGDLQVTADDLDVLGLVGFFNDFAAGAAVTTTPGVGRTPGVSTTPGVLPGRSGGTMRLTLGLEADRATFGDLAIADLAGRAVVTEAGLTLDPLRFGVFGGTTEGTLAFTFASTPAFHLVGSVSNADVAQAMAFAGSPDTITGRASGRLDLSGSGVSADAVARTARGTARLDVVDGAITGLGLVRTVVLATSGRADSQAAAATSRSDGSFSRLALTATIDNGMARTSDLVFESPDVLMGAAGTVQLATTETNLAAEVQLSEDLSRSSGRDLVRYTQQNGRVTVPATVTGPLGALSVRIDLADAARRAIANRAAEEAKKALAKRLGKIIKRK